MKTVKVRIAVAVDPSGDWNSDGWMRGKDKDMREQAVDPLQDGAAVYWLTAELPVPEAQEIAATVEEAKT